MKKAIVALGVLILLVVAWNVVRNCATPAPSKQSSTSPSNPKSETPAHPPVEVASKNLPKSSIAAQTPASVQTPGSSNPRTACFISGLVVDGSGRPVSGVLVDAKSALQSSSVTTNLAGEFALANLAPGRYKIALSKRMPNGLTPEHEIQRDFVLKPGRNIQGERLVYGEWSISGRVTDSKGEPLSDIEIRASGSDAYPLARSGADGRYILGGLAERAYSLSAYGEKYQHANLDNVESGSTGVDFVLEPGFQIDGRVVDAATGVPVQKFELSWDIASEFKPAGDEQGRFTEWLRQATSYDVFVRADGYAVATERIQTQQGQYRYAVEIRLDRGRDFFGAVRDSSGKPVEGASVLLGTVHSVDDLEGIGAGRCISGADGTFVLRSFPKKGSQPITVYHPKFPVCNVEAIEGLDRQNPVEVILSDGGVVKGTVHFAEPPTDAKLIIFIHPAPGLTLDPGRERKELSPGDYSFEFTGIRAGRATADLIISQASNSPSRSLVRPVVIENDAVTQIDFDVPPNHGTGTVEGNVSRLWPYPLEVDGVVGKLCLIGRRPVASAATGLAAIAR